MYSLDMKNINFFLLVINYVELHSLYIHTLTNGYHRKWFASRKQFPSYKQTRFKNNARIKCQLQIATNHKREFERLSKSCKIIGCWSRHPAVNPSTILRLCLFRTRTKFEYTMQRLTTRCNFFYVFSWTQPLSLLHPM